MSTTLAPIATALKTKLETLAASTENVKGYAKPPRELDSVPCGVVEIPSIERVDPDTAESQLGTNDWHIVFPVVLYVDLSEADYSITQAIDFVEAWIKAIDADQTLGGAVFDCKVTSAEPLVIDDEARPLLAYETRVAVWALVA